MKLIQAMTSCNMSSFSYRLKSVARNNRTLISHMATTIIIPIKPALPTNLIYFYETTPIPAIKTPEIVNIN
jgi:hypothetical protein